MDLGIGLPSVVPGTSRAQLPTAPGTPKTPGSPPRHHRPHRLSQLRALDRPLRGGGGHEAHPPCHRRHARPAARERRDGGKADPLPRRAGGRRPRRPRHRARRARGRLRDQRRGHVDPRRLARPRPGEDPRIWNGEGELEAKVGPRPIGDGPTLIVGGYVEPPSSGRPDSATAGPRAAPAPSVHRRQEETRRSLEGARPRGQAQDDGPRLLLPRPNAEENARSSLLSYYAWLGNEAAEGIAGSAAKDADTVKGYISTSRSTAATSSSSSPVRPTPNRSDSSPRQPASDREAL